MFSNMVDNMVSGYGSWVYTGLWKAGVYVVYGVYGGIGVFRGFWGFMGNMGEYGGIWGIWGQWSVRMAVNRISQAHHCGRLACPCPASHSKCSRRAASLDQSTGRFIAID